MAEKSIRNSRLLIPPEKRRLLDQMQCIFNSRFLKPQRPIRRKYGGSIDDKYKRLLETWQYWDVCLHKACFADIKDLENLVVNPQQFRDNIRHTVITMSDQLLCSKFSTTYIPITLDVEQTLHDFFTEGEPVANWGITSVILPGAQRSSLGKRGSYLYSIELLLYVLASSA